MLADDLGWTDLGCYGSKYYKTPNIDRLARNGMRFTHAHSAGPNCAPTRAALMTGQYGPRTGVYTVGTGARGAAEGRKLVPVENVTQLPLDRVTVAQALKGLGYQTALFGKWHLGEKKEHHPAQRGFDEAIVSMGKHFNFVTNPKLPIAKDAYLADFLTDKALDFIQRNKDKPFFLYLAHFGVHTPLEAKPELLEKYRKKKGGGGHDNPVYAAMIESVDESVGRVVAMLERLKLTENTIVIFSSDNGGVGGYAAAGVKGARDITNNAPLRGGKGMLYEGGVRVCWIVAWRGKVPAGGGSEEPIISVDLFPTCVDLAGGAGKAAVKQPLDGKSLAPLFLGKEKTLKRDALFWHFPGYLEAGAKATSWRTTPAGAIRAGDWKLLEFFEDGRLELYNLRDDPSQKNNLAAAEAERRRELHERLVAWRRDVKAPMPRGK
ncbi:MAG: sulfatase [Gemmataceae bacterium]